MASKWPEHQECTTARMNLKINDELRILVHSNNNSDNKNSLIDTNILLEWDGFYLERFPLWGMAYMGNMYFMYIFPMSLKTYLKHEV